MRLIAKVAIAVMVASGCASPGMPPGGPPDVEAPRLVGVAPDSGRVSVSPRAVVFRFDEVVSETPPGATTLANLFVISPQQGSPVVTWQREEISVRPRRGWRPNTVYSVTMLPGLADLRGNVRKEGAATLFATGPVIPATSISGVLWDWEAGAPVTSGLVQAMTPDSTIYLAYSDNAGAFSLRHLPAGIYQVTGVVDGNRNRALDPRESWDTITVTLADTARVELFTFAHDSTGPRIENVVAEDSVTLRVQFDVAVHPGTALDPSWVRVIGPDSAALPVTGVALPEAPASDTSSTGRQRARPDSLVRGRPYREVKLTMAAPLRPGVTYTVIADGFPGLLGRVTSSRDDVMVPATPVVPPAAPPATPP